MMRNTITNNDVKEIFSKISILKFDENCIPAMFSYANCAIKGFDFEEADKMFQKILTKKIILKKKF
jgi:hypothetical protein